MELKKLAPWNWFKKEEEIAHTVPIKHGQNTTPPAEGYFGPIQQMHHDIDRLFERFFRESAPWGNEWPSLPIWEGDSMLKPRVDLSGAEKEYMLTVEIPGVDEKDVSVDVSGGILTIRGEKKQEKEDREADYYRIERRYGSFQRVLSLPDDVDQENIKAGFKNGVLTITMPRKAVAKSEVRRIQIKSAS